MDRIECSVWNNGGEGWGLKVLGGPTVRRTYFRPEQSPILLELDGSSFPVNIDKRSFWTRGCGELISSDLRGWIVKHQMTTGDRVWLEVLQPHQTFRAIRSQSELPAREIA